MYQGTLTINPVGAKLKKNHDFFTKMDPYLVIKVGSQTQKTKVHHRGGKNPSWDQPYSFELRGRATMVQLTCFDKDTFSKDDFVGEANIPIQELARKKTGQDWFPMIRKGKNVGEVLVSWKMLGGADSNPMKSKDRSYNQAMNYQPPPPTPPQQAYIPPRPTYPYPAQNQPPMSNYGNQGYYGGNNMSGPNPMPRNPNQNNQMPAYGRQATGYGMNNAQNPYGRQATGFGMGQNPFSRQGTGFGGGFGF